MPLRNVAAGIETECSLRRLSAIKVVRDKAMIKGILSAQEKGKDALKEADIAGLFEAGERKNRDVGERAHDLAAGAAGVVDGEIVAAVATLEASL